MTAHSFNHLPLDPALLHNLETLGYLHMTPIQAQSLPLILNQQDVIAKASTGSGKTAAFGLGILAKLEDQMAAPQALVICPTRELANQVGKEIRRLARCIPNIRVLTLCGGKPFGFQAEALRFRPHVVVGTPGRLQDHVNKKTLRLDKIKTLVLDEADRMLDMGFYDEIMALVDEMPDNRQTLLFSATYPPEIADISEQLQKSAHTVTVADEATLPAIEQFAYYTSDKDHVLLQILAQYQQQSAIVFCRTKRECEEVAMSLVDNGFYAQCLHGDLEQSDRDEVLLQFANLSCTILVATDVAARGLDIKDLPLVINYDLPSAVDVYVHRIGRTGRQGQFGMAISLLSARESFKIDAINQSQAMPIQINEVKDLPIACRSMHKPTMQTLCLGAGKKNKIRPGDILGALTGDMGLQASQIGKIDIFDFRSYVAIERTTVAKIGHQLQSGKIKGRQVKIRLLESVN